MPILTRLRWPEAMGSWTVDDYSMCGGHMKPLNLEKLWSIFIVGENEELSGVDGKLEREFFIDQQEVTLNCQLAGGVDFDGVATSSNIVGLQTNYDVLTGLSKRPTSGYTRESVLVKPDGLTYTANLQLRVSSLEKEGGGFGRVNLTVIVPSGLWVVSGG